jgi:hypothetical protein
LSQLPTFVVTTQPPSNVNAGQGFGLVVRAEIGSTVDSSFNGHVTVFLASVPPGAPTTFSGGQVTVTAVNGVATFSGLTLQYGGDYTLQLVSSGTNAPEPTTTGAFHVNGPLPPPPPPPAGNPPTIIGESVVVSQKTNKKGKKVGKPVVTGYTITFSTAMNQTSLASATNYEIDVLKSIKTVTTKVGKRKIKTKVPVYARAGFTIPAASLMSNSVTLVLAGKQTFPKGGRIQVFAGGVDNSSGVALAQTVIRTISPKGTGIS